MSKAERAKRVDPSQADRYADVGRSLLNAGRTLAELGDKNHASALAILSVHAAIAFGDAAAIHAGGRKSTSSDHSAAVRLLRTILGPRFPATTEKAMKRVISEKDKFEYQGDVATMSDAGRLFGLAEQVGRWAEEILTSRKRSGA